MRLGIAVGPERVTGLVRGSVSRTVSVVVELTPPAGRSPGNGGDDTGDRLAAAFADLARRLEEAEGVDTAGARLSLAFLPPLSEMRAVPLPPLSQEEAEAVVARDAGRYFMGAAGPTVVGVARGRRGAPVTAAAAPTALLEAARDAAERTGWVVERMAPAQAAWRAWLRDRPESAAVVAHGGTAHVIRDRPDGLDLRRVPATSAADVAEALGGARAILVTGDPPAARDLVDALRARGREASLLAEAGGSAAEAAAMRAAEADPELVPPSLSARRRERGRRRVAVMVGAAALLVVAAGAVHLLGAHRELEAVRAARAGLADEVAPLIALRDSVDALGERVRAVRAVTDRSAAWTRALSELAVLLPTDAHVTSLVAEGDLLELEAAGERAGAAIQALRRAGSLQDVRLEGIVERELENGETVVERFRLSARLAPRAAGGAGEDR